MREGKPEAQLGALVWSWSPGDPGEAMTSQLAFKGALVAQERMG